MTVQHPPADFLCPLSKALMVDPVKTPNGISYERAAIVPFLQKREQKSCPLTGAPLRVSSLVSNIDLQWKIRYWRKKTGYDDYDYSDDYGSATTTNGTSETNHSRTDDCDEQTNKTTTERRKSVSIEAIPQQRFICSLTGQVMKFPMMTPHGYNYEQKAILKWILLRGEICPISAKPLKVSDVVFNSKLDWEIRKWKRDSGVGSSSQRSICCGVLSVKRESFSVDERTKQEEEEEEKKDDNCVETNNNNDDDSNNNNNTSPLLMAMMDISKAEPYDREGFSSKANVVATTTPTKRESLPNMSSGKMAMNFLSKNVHNNNNNKKKTSPSTIVKLVRKTFSPIKSKRRSRFLAVGEPEEFTSICSLTMHQSTPF